jgi:hypothetical protein
MSKELQVIQVHNESEAIALLAKYQDIKEPLKDVIFNVVNFEDFNLYICGEKYSGVMNSDMMQSAIALQNNINRLYAYLTYGIADARKLTQSEREKLELQFAVGKGSVDIKAEVAKIAQLMISRMKSEHILILGCVFLICYFGSSEVRHYIDTNAQSNKDKDLVRIMDKLADKIPEVKYIREESESVKDLMLKKSVQFDEGIKLNGHHITQDQIKEKIKTVKETATSTRLDGFYKVLGIDWQEGYTRVEIEAMQDQGAWLKKGEKIYAYNHKDLFYDSKNNITIKLKEEDAARVFSFKINATIQNGKIVDASIIEIDRDAKQN